ncbi:hypothetical protein [Sphingobacterium luzhongxinii]|uniref:hypothetical protein n=1 Tax=Sphingobacterium luzhongxinii TaxID=2654181 RepID=UPI0013D9EBD9|nr:hypothetical protein [Sphingobacterium sp. xlx-73]
MDLNTLKYLEDKGYRYLLRSFGKKAFVPLRKVPNRVSDTPLAEDELLSISDAIDNWDSEFLEYRLIIVM